MLNPPAGAAADYAWLAGQVWTYPENPPCSTLDMYGGRKSYESNVPLTGMVWDAAHKQGLLPDGSFVMVFGYIQQWQSVREPAPTNGMCSNPFAYVVERVLVNRHPALDGSQGPAPAANSPLVIPTDDSSTPVEIHVGDRVKVVPHGHYLNWLPFPMQVEHPEILVREADSQESRGSQGIYQAIAPGKTRIGGIMEPCPGCKSNPISFGVDLIIR